ncbi:DUF6192 family protein [Streptomyces sp. SID12501]|uniref:DUF6192 family protein n=1 Tax=Streptomyces sp. SID12501 TaxID=2706042 RepID=UPI0034E0B2C6
MFAKDAVLAQTLACGDRRVSSHRSNMRRRAYVSYTTRKVLANISAERERFEAPRPNPSGGPPRWTRNSAQQPAGWKINSPENVQDTTETIHGPTTDDAVAAAVRRLSSSGLLCTAFQGDTHLKFVSYSS